MPSFLVLTYPTYLRLAFAAERKEAKCDLKEADKYQKLCDEFDQARTQALLFRLFHTNQRIDEVTEHIKVSSSSRLKTVFNIFVHRWKYFNREIQYAKGLKILCQIICVVGLIVINIINKERKKERHQKYNVRCCRINLGQINHVLLYDNHPVA